MRTIFNKNIECSICLLPKTEIKCHCCTDQWHYSCINENIMVNNDLRCVVCRTKIPKRLLNKIKQSVKKEIVIDIHLEPTRLIDPRTSNTNEIFLRTCSGSCILILSTFIFFSMITVTLD